MKTPGRWMGGSGLSRLDAGAKNSSEKERMREERGAEIRSVGMEISQYGTRVLTWVREAEEPMQVELKVEFMRSVGMESAIAGDWGWVSWMISGESA